MPLALARRSRSLVLPLLVCARAALGADPRDAMVSAAQDNSFLLQEAYNQEAGEVQTIASLELDGDSGERDWETLLSQEWPVFSSDHQLSFVVPIEVVAGDGESASGLGDVVLAYRYQLVRETEQWPAVAPYFGLSLPTGKERDGFGDGNLGYAFTLPLSKVLSDRLQANLNAGVSYVPHTQGAGLDDYSAGASAVYALSSSWSLLLEWVAESDQTLDGRKSDRDFVSQLSPGARYALDVAGGQLVLGLAAPTGLSSESPDWGVFLYLSFERRFWDAEDGGD